VGNNNWSGDFVIGYSVARARGPPIELVRVPHQMNRLIVGMLQRSLRDQFHTNVTINQLKMEDSSTISKSEGIPIHFFGSRDSLSYISLKPIAPRPKGRLPAKVFGETIPHSST
jgi:hypothetical protein